MHGTKEARQKLMNETAVQTLRNCPDMLGMPLLRRAMKMSRQHTTGAYYLPYLDEWDRLLDSGDVEEIALYLLADDEHGRALRVTSPLAFLLTDQQRTDVISQSLGVSAVLI